MKEKIFQIINFLKYKLFARHRKGFSVHSPFVFELLNNVFFEKEYYYCYNEIEKIVAKNTHKSLFFNKLKYYKLFFRLANYFNAQKILIVGKNNFIEKIFTFVSSKTKIFYAENIEKMEKNDFDLMFFAEGHFDQREKSRVQNRFLPAVEMTAKKDNSILIFENIYKNENINEIWKNIITDNNLKISIDIFRYGIIINKNDIPKQHYRVAF